MQYTYPYPYSSRFPAPLPGAANIVSFAQRALLNDSTQCFSKASLQARYVCMTCLFNEDFVVSLDTAPGCRVRSCLCSAGRLLERHLHIILAADSGGLNTWTSLSSRARGLHIEAAHQTLTVKVPLLSLQHALSVFGQVSVVLTHTSTGC